ncbi:MAG TPA: hypothetical protein VID68_05550, partial [Solirubrobacteraceae bacterium]
MSTATSTPADDAGEAIGPPGAFEPRAIARSVAGIGLYAGVFGATFGAVSVGSRLSIAQTMA